MIVQPADILMWRIGPGASWIDRLIGWGERKTGQPKSDQVNYYHVGFIAADPRQFYESKPPRICLSRTPDILPSYIEAYRLKTMPTSEKLKAMFAYADSRLGTVYNFLGVLTMGWLNVAGHEFCSQFTNDAFSYADITLVPHHLLESPDDIAASPLLARIQ